ncbi:hypothetical protein S245_045163, partial [Arachis hypogaea]
NCSSSGARSIIPSSSSSSQILVPFFSDLRERERIKSFVLNLSFKSSNFQPRATEASEISSWAIWLELLLRLRQDGLNRSVKVEFVTTTFSLLAFNSANSFLRTSIID